MVSQVPVIGILMIVNGSLACLLGLLYIVLGPTLMTFAGMDRRNFRDEDRVIFIVLVVYGAVILTSGLMNIFGGIRALRYRSRAFVLTALFFNILSLCSYCAPTSLGLIIYGLIVMFQQDVGRAFAMGEEGAPVDTIKRRFQPKPDRYYDEDDDDYGERDEERRLPPPKKPPPRGTDDDDRYYEK